MSQLLLAIFFMGESLDELKNFIDKDEKLEGLISLLASCAHDWKCWRITRERHFSLASSQTLKEWVRLEVEERNGSRREGFFEGDFSPSGFYYDLRSQRASAGLWTEPQEPIALTAAQLEELLHKPALRPIDKLLIRKEIRGFMEAQNLCFYYGPF